MMAIKMMTVITIIMMGMMKTDYYCWLLRLVYVRCNVKVAIKMVTMLMLKTDHYCWLLILVDIIKMVTMITMTMMATDHYCWLLRDQSQ